MVVKCLKALEGALSAIVLAMVVTPGPFGASNAWAAQDPAISFEELDAAEKKTKKAKVDKLDETDEAAEAKKAQEEAKERPARRSVLPSVDQLIEAKISALKARQDEQEKELGVLDARLAQEIAIENKVFDQSAYLSVSMINSAPGLDYRLDGTEIYVDGKLIAKGGKRNHGLPRAQEVFFGPVPEGCHQLLVKAKYTRLKNDILQRFKVNRVEHIVETQAFVAKKGYRLDIEIQGFEKHSTFVNWYRGPAVRFNRSVRPNFLPGAAMVSIDEVLKQGRVKIEYITEDQSTHRLLKKSLRLDGLPILVDELHDQAQSGNVVFDAPLREGKHTLNVTLLFAEKKWISGGPSYNFRLSFDREFYVIGGQTTLVNLTGMPKGGIRNNLENSRYARASSKIFPEENQEFFPPMTCQEIKEQEKQAQKAATQKAQQLEENKAEPVPSEQPAVIEGVESPAPKTEQPEAPKPEQGNAPMEPALKPEEPKEEKPLEDNTPNKPAEGA